MRPPDCSEDEKEFNEPNSPFDSMLLELLLLTILSVSDAPTSTVQSIVVATFSCAAPQSDRSIAHASEDKFYKYYDDAFISSCELRNLQSYWGLSDRYETKLAIGKKLAAKKNIDSDIRKAAEESSIN